MAHKNIEKLARAAKIAQQEKERKYSMRELILLIHTTNYILICIGIILIGIFVKLTFGS